MMATSKTDLTIGKPAQKILIFAIPIFLGNILQQLYNIADIRIVGQYLGDDALAAIAATVPLISLMMNFMYGLNSGFSIVVARYYGAKNLERMKKAVALTLVSGFAITLLLTVVSPFLIDDCLKLLKTPDSVINQSHQYIIVLVYGMIVTMAYNLAAGILRAIGNSTMPLVFLGIASSVNIFLDIVLIVVLHLGIQGAAVATVFAQLISVICCLIYIKKRCPLLKVEKEHFKRDAELLKELWSAGLSVACMLCTVSFGTIILQTAINDFGKSTITAHLAARKISEMYMLVLSTLSLATSTFASQNLGAFKLARIKEGVKESLKMAWIYATVIIVLTFLLAPIMVAGLTGTHNQKIIKTAVQYLKINLPFYYVLSILLILRSTLQGIDHKIAPIIASLFELIGKIWTVLWLVPKFDYIGICLSEPIVWTVCCIIVGVDFLRDQRLKEPPQNATL